MKRWLRIFPGLLALMAALLACNLPLGPRDPQSATITAAIKTIKVGLTGTAAMQTVTAAAAGTRLPTLPGGTATLAGLTPVSTCNQGQFIDDLSIPDGSRMRPGENFTKTWRIKNSGACTWTPDYAVVFDSGTAMGAPASVRFAQAVGPGATVDISIPMTAPPTPGRVRGNWKLQSAGGERFGLGNDGKDAFYVEIEVIAATQARTNTPPAPATATNRPGATLTATPRATSLILDMAARYCEAEWRSGGGILTCPGKETDAAGFVLRQDQPKLQDGQVWQKPGLVLMPQNVHNGAVSGRFPSFKVAVGDHFRATIGCAEGKNNCNVLFQLNYRVNGGPVQNFGQWDMAYANRPVEINMSLTPMANQNIELVLAVIANGPADGDWAVWVNPRVEH